MFRPLSIGAKWALRYMVVMIITASVFAWYVQQQAERRIREDASLLLDVQLVEMLGVVDGYPGELPLWRRYAKRQVDAGARELGLGIRIIDLEGKTLTTFGSIAELDPPLPTSLVDGSQVRDEREYDLGHGAPYLALAERGKEAIVQIFIDSVPFSRNAALVRDALWAGLPIVLGLTVVLGWGLSRGSLRPISEIARTARTISTANLSESIPTTGTGDELDELSHTLNDLLGRIRTGVERIQRFSLDAAHQLRTPLTGMQSQIEVTLAKERPPGEYRQALRDMLGQVGTLSATIDGMLRLAHSEGGLDAAHRVPVDLDRLLEEVVDFFQPLADERGLALSARIEAPGHVEGDVVWLHQLFANLMHNAIEYTPPGGRVWLYAVREDDEVRISIRDTGVGLSERDRGRIFEGFERVEPSDTTRERGAGGLGLGLTLAREIARGHGGRIEVDSEEEHGSEFTVVLPAFDGPAPA